MSMKLKTNKEFKDICPPLTEARYNLLEKRIIEEGCRNDLIVWDGVIIDGHNRYEICKKHGIEFGITEYDFDNDKDAKIWIIDNQRGRRNLTDGWDFELAQVKKTILLDKHEKERKKHRVSNVDTQDKKSESGRTRKEIAKDLGWSTGKVAMADKVWKEAKPEVKDKIKAGKTSINQAYKDIKKIKKQEQIKENKKNITETLKKEIKTKPQIYLEDYKEFLERLEDKSQDLLITDPPYLTDIDDIEIFADDWLNKALSKLKDTGRAFICIGAYPKEIQAYLNILLKQDRFIVDNPLIWTYRNTLGRTPNNKYNLNYQMIWHLYSKSSKPLDKSITKEMFSVQDINAPDGRKGDRYHTWQKPNELARRLIKHSTKEDDKIFDIFACTGTFLLIGSKMNRQVTGCDISKENLKIAEERGCEIL